jgi:hypothetical protein
LTGEEREARRSLENLTYKVSEAWTLIQGGSDDRTSDTAVSVVTNLKRIDVSCSQNALDVKDWAQASLADRVHMLLENRKTLDPNASQDSQGWDELASKVVRDITIAEKTIAGGTKGHIPDSSTTDPEAVGMINYVVHEVETISHVCETNKAQTNDWETLSLAGRVSAIAANQQSPELRSKFNDAMWIVTPGIGIPVELTSIDRIDKILQALQTIEKDVNNVPFADDKWRVEPLAEKVNYILAQRNRFDQESDKPSSVLSNLLLHAIFELLPRKGVWPDPTGKDYVNTILQELQSITQAVDSTVDGSPEEVIGTWKGQSLAERVKSIVTQLKTREQKVSQVLSRLGQELETMHPGAARDRIFEILQKIFPDLDLPEPKREYTIFDPDA